MMSKGKQAGANDLLWKAEYLITILEEGPWFVRDLETTFRMNGFQMHVLIDNANQVLMRSDRVIKLSEGNRGSVGVCGIRHINEE